MPLFSVIIPTYNRAELVSATLQSVLAQRLQDFEVLVVDDGSTDGTVAVVKSFADRVRLLQQANKGPGSARNRAADRATGQYLAFLDSDDVWFPWTLESYANAIAKTNRPAFVAGKPYRFATVGALQAVGEDALRFGVFPDYFASSDEWRWWGASSFVVRADVFRNAGGFTSRWINGEDADLALRLGEARGFVHVTSPATFGYREHDANATQNRERTLEGVWHAVSAEQQRAYPGGAGRAVERRRIISRHVRPVAIDCLRNGPRRDAWRLYLATLAWNLRTGHWKFVVGFPLMALGLSPLGSGVEK